VRGHEIGEEIIFPVSLDPVVEFVAVKV